jgi:hypothetical protein
MIYDPVSLVPTCGKHFAGLPLFGKFDAWLLGKAVSMRMEVQAMAAENSAGCGKDRQEP